ncbi:uncharacterized protein HKW66_Vig0193470 [Vigna angularis]|uniref:Uncharacterized protein n=1 Tax=Phaseolus angularis TaxID=3914 RepID=A0A8T0KNH9_PHAAN|nr:uncharacterized protein HKW66_Vig0193470 [Vigna angularis]
MKGGLTSFTSRTFSLEALVAERPAAVPDHFPARQIALHQPTPDGRPLHCCHVFSTIADARSVWPTHCSPLPDVHSAIATCNPPLRAHVHSLAVGAPLTLLTHPDARQLASVSGCRALLSAMFTAEVARSPAATWPPRGRTFFEA